MTTENKASITKWFPNSNSLAQVYSSGLEYAFVNAEGVQCHPFAYCKDYMQDAIWATLHNQPAGIWGFKYTPGENPPLDMEAMRVAVRLRNFDSFLKSRNMTGLYGDTLGALCQRSLQFMNQLEEEQGFSKTTLEYGGTFEDTKDEVWVFTGDKQWMFSPVWLSMYTVSLRVGMSYVEGPWRDHFKAAKHYLGTNDASYTTSAMKKLDVFVGKKPSEIFAPTIEQNYPADVAISALHHHSGVVSFGDGQIGAGVNKHWAIK